MPRIAEARPSAEPSSPGQKARHQRILRAAAKQGAEYGLERVQMLDIAKEAGVAIATLYRYFPSKTHLFTAVMADQVARLEEVSFAAEPGQDPVEAVADLLVEASRQLLRRPLLANAMMQSNNASPATPASPAGRIDTAFRDLIVRTLGLDEPTDHDLRLVRLVEQGWYGILTQSLNRGVDLADAEADIRLACRLLLVERSNA
ncbi:TetR family transcriptional regulator [Nocardioides speluncae]|uniref:TetR family transcriptional regulator n=1 Tax=Nocardioides speluncae TaxID=2670337 RepID=UPI000D6943F2|nr:TetR family transcriptional regulator [Nocardioides speluncae]